MSIEGLKKFKRLVITSGLILSTLSFTGCGEKSNILESDVLEEKADEGLEENSDKIFVAHDHLEIAGYTYIFRECDPEIQKIKATWQNSCVQFWIYDADGNIIFNYLGKDNVHLFNIDTELEEENVQEVEEDLIENNAKLRLELDK